MTREESIIRARRAARGYERQRREKKSLLQVMIVQLLVCVIIFGGIMSMSGVIGVRDSIEYYLNYTVDCKASVDEIIDRCKSVIMVNDDA